MRRRGDYGELVWLYSNAGRLLGAGPRVVEALLAIVSPFSPVPPGQLLDFEVPARETNPSGLLLDVILGLLQPAEEALRLPGDLIRERDELGENQEPHLLCWEDGLEKTADAHFGLLFFKGQGIGFY